MKCLIIVLPFLTTLKFTPKRPTSGEMKCIPFHAHTAVPIHERVLEQMGKPSIKQEIITDNQAITKAYQSLKRAVTRPSHKRDDYDLRMVLRFRFSDKSLEIFYVDWDRKGLLYKDTFYLIGQDELKTIGRAFNCEYCNTGKR